MRLYEFTAGRKGRDEKLIPVGFWWSKSEPELPMPDSNDSIEHEDEILAFLQNHDDINSYRGSSLCRLCDKKNNGSREKSDGVYIWPDGLAHYVEDHKTTLPAEFVQHILDNPVERDLEAEAWAKRCKERRAQRQREREQRNK